MCRVRIVSLLEVFVCDKHYHRPSLGLLTNKILIHTSIIHLWQLAIYFTGFTGFSFGKSIYLYGSWCARKIERKESGSILVHEIFFVLFNLFFYTVSTNLMFVSVLTGYSSRFSSNPRANCTWYKIITTYTCYIYECILIYWGNINCCLPLEVELNIRLLKYPMSTLDRKQTCNFMSQSYVFNSVKPCELVNMHYEGSWHIALVYPYTWLVFLKKSSLRRKETSVIQKYFLHSRNWTLFKGVWI